MSQTEDDATPADVEVQPVAPQPAVGSPASTDTAVPHSPVEPITPPVPGTVLPSKTKATESPSSTVPILDSNHTGAQHQPPSTTN